MREVLAHIDSVLSDSYEALELESVKRALLIDYLGVSPISFYTREPLAPDPEREIKLNYALSRLSKGEPLQYVIGSTPFCGLQFKVDKRVLIPRPETAELVEWVARDCSGVGSVVDIGTGSGCIAVTLATRLPGWKVQGWDISNDALEVARENSRLNGTDVEFRNVDILGVPEPGEHFDAIVSNPPYVLESEKAQMDNRVLDFEPHMALFVPDGDALLYYRAIAELGRQVLNRDGRLYFEINPLEAGALENMLSDTGYHDIELRKDIFGKLRMIKAVL